MRGACIDIGSNTTRLLVAELVGGRLVEICQERVFTRTGWELERSGRIGEAKIAQIVAVVADQLASARGLEAEVVHGVATAAVRRAADGHRLIDLLARETGLSIRVLTGEQEARLAFVGAAAMLDRPAPRTLGVIDVGGGSCELVVGDPVGAVRWWASLELGSASLTAALLPSDPPRPIELRAAETAIDAALHGISPPSPELAVAVGGSATSLARIAGPTLDPAALERALARLVRRPAAAVAREHGLDPDRARLLPAGLLILRAAGAALRTVATVGAGGIREGVLVEALTP